MFCPKCWEQYPKGWVNCKACDVPLVEQNPNPSKPEVKPDAGRRPQELKVPKPRGRAGK